MASASSSRSTVTNLSPALSAIFSAVSKSAGQLLGEIELAGAAAGDLGPLGQHPLDRGKRVAGTAAGALDQAGGHALRVVEQHLQEVLGAELLMALAQGQALRRLDESLGAVGVFLEIHSIPPRYGARPHWARNRRL